MSMTFYCGSGSPFAWKVWLTLEHKKIPYELKMLSFSAGDTKKPEYLKINPRGQVPALVDGDLSLYESQAIVEYLEEKAPQPALFSKDAKKRAHIRQVIDELDHYFAVPMEILVGEFLFTEESKRNPEKIEQGKKDIFKELGFWEQNISGNYICGELSVADFSFYPMLALVFRIEKKKMNLGVRESLGPKLSAWVKRMEALPVMEKTWPPHWKESP